MKPSFAERWRRRVGGVALLGASLVPTSASAEAPEVRAMREELDRTMQQLRLPHREPAYYGAYWLVDYEQRSIDASLGALVFTGEDSGRRVHVSLRVGSPAMDNSHVADARAMFDLSDGLSPAPMGNDVEVLRRALWLNSDQAYRNAIERLDQKGRERSAEIELELRPADFSDQLLTPIDGPEAPPLPSGEVMESLATSVSSVFARYPAIEESRVSITASRVARTLVTSDGITSREHHLLVEVKLHASLQASDGMILSHQETVFDTLDEERLAKAAGALATSLSELAGAELVGDYFGPVLFEDRAAAQIAHDMLAMNLSATPMFGEEAGGLARRLGKRVLPDAFWVYDDPGLHELAGFPLIGHYLMDDEGVAAERVSLVERGRLRGLLTSRTPSREFSISNGHGRSGLGGWARGMIGNLIVETRQGLGRAALRQRLLRAARDQGVAYALVVQRLGERGFSTGGVSPPAPERMLRLYPDGREVLVRGGSLGEINVRELRNVIAAGREPRVYNTLVNWSSGFASPSSVVAPDLLFEEVELTAPKRSTQRPKALARPPAPTPSE